MHAADHHEADHLSDGSHELSWENLPGYDEYVAEAEAELARENAEDYDHGSPEARREHQRMLVQARRATGLIRSRALYREEYLRRMRVGSAFRVQATGVASHDS